MPPCSGTHQLRLSHSIQRREDLRPNSASHRRRKGISNLAISCGFLVAKQARLAVVLHNLHRILTYKDRFAGVGKVIAGIVPGGLTRGRRLPDRIFKPVPLAVPKRGLQVAGTTMLGVVIAGLPKRLKAH